MRRLSAGIDDLKFLGFLRAAAARTGQQLNYKGIADDAEIDLLLEQDGTLFPIEIKKMAAPPKKLTKVFELIDKPPLQRGTGAVLCMADKLGAFDQDNLVVPISLI